MKKLAWLVSRDWGIAIAFGVVAVLHAFMPLRVDWETIVLMAVATSPWLLSLLTHNFQEFAIGPGGISGKAQSKTINVEQIPPAPLTAANVRQQGESHGEGQPFASLLSETRKILGTLWRNQQELFRDDNNKRWGFQVGPASPDFRSYLAGVADAIKLGFVVLGDRGFAFLTDDGLAYGKTNAQAISNENNYYVGFSG